MVGVAVFQGPLVGTSAFEVRGVGTDANFTYIDDTKCLVSQHGRRLAGRSGWLEAQFRPAWRGDFLAVGATLPAVGADDEGVGFKRVAALVLYEDILLHPWFEFGEVWLYRFFVR
jgi:hypothetical protein